MMEYQIVPTRKPGQVKTKKHRAPECCNKCDKARQNEDSNIFILQPMLKLPKSTREVKSAEDETSIVVSAVRASNSTDANSFNHFTMSRKGLVKGIAPPNMSRVEDPWNGLVPHLALSSNKPSSSEKPRILHISGDYSDKRRVSSYEVSGERSRDKIRRASAGDALVKSNQNSEKVSPRLLTIGPDEVLIIPQRKHQRSKSHQLENGRQSEQSSASGNKMDTQGDDRLKPNLDCTVRRRKSFHDWQSMRQWYCTDEFPVSNERRPSEKRNVISPTTLSRLVPPESNTNGPRQGSAALSVCTEGDMMSYNFNLPSRRLVSHKELKSCTLPYSDNIGLEETVSSDQARKGAKLKASIAVKKKYENSRQTPKQVWYRTIRSILAANHLYHSVKNKKTKKSSVS